MIQKRVMIVDDSAMMRLIVSNMLSRDPRFAVIAYAENGRQALEALASEKPPQPDLILLDLEMPEIDGIEFLIEARSKTKAKIVVLTSVAPAGSHKAARAVGLGADAIVCKPSGAVSFDLEKERGSEFFSVIYRLLCMETPQPR